MEILAILTFIGATISAFLFRRGGVYNPEMPSTDHTITEIPLVEAPKQPQVESLTESTPMDSESSLILFCTAIRDFEGGVGDPNYKNNNPGNCRWNPSGYLPMYGKVKKSPAGFAIFPTYEQGWKYLVNMVKGQIHKRPNLTIYEFMLRYAPPEDSNPTDNYAKFIGKRLGVDSYKFKVGNLV